MYLLSFSVLNICFLHKRFPKLIRPNKRPTNPVLSGVQGKAKYMLIKTAEGGGGDGGGEDFSLDGEECPKEMPCIDCGDACKSDVNKATCPYDWGKCEDDRKANVKCVGDMWDYEDYASLKCSKGGGGEDFSLAAAPAAASASACPKEQPCPVEGGIGECKAPCKQNDGPCEYDIGKCKAYVLDGENWFGAGQAKFECLGLQDKTGKRDAKNLVWDMTNHREIECSEGEAAGGGG